MLLLVILENCVLHHATTCYIRELAVNITLFLGCTKLKHLKGRLLAVREIHKGNYDGR